MGVSAETAFVQFGADGCHATVHHVARRDHVRARLGVAGGRVRQQFQRRVVQDFHWSAGHRPGGFRVFSSVPSPFPALRPDNAAMAVFHVFAQADVGDDQQRRQFLFQQPDGLLDNAVLRVSAGGPGVLFVGNAKKQNGRHADGVGARRFADDFIRRKLEHSGHGLDGAAQFFAEAREQRQDQLVHVQVRFGHEPPQCRRLPQPARAINRESRQSHASSLVFADAGQKWKVEPPTTSLETGRTTN